MTNIKRVLQISIGGKNFTGVASYLHQYYRHIDRSKMHFDFLFCRENSMEIVMDDPIYKNSSFFTINAIKKKSKSNDYHKIITGIRKVLNEEQYDVIVVNTSVVAVVMACIIANFPYRVRCFISHAHNTKLILGKDAKRRKIGPLMNVIDGIIRFIVNRYSTYLFACSEEAGMHTFGYNVNKKKNFIVIKNAINLNEFKFNKKIRNEIRKKMSVSSNTIIYGNVGQMIEKKNQKFLLKIFAEIYSKQPNSELWIIGDGPERYKLNKEIDKLNLNDNVRILGQRNDVNKVMQAMDCFVFTTLSEGLGIVAVEAQAAGLVTFISDGVPKEVLITKLAHQISLQEDSKVWAENILKVTNNLEIRRDRSQEIAMAGYDIYREAKKMTDFYSRLKK